MAFVSFVQIQQMANLNISLEGDRKLQSTLFFCLYVKGDIRSSSRLMRYLLSFFPQTVSPGHPSTPEKIQFSSAMNILIVQTEKTISIKI